MTLRVDYQSANFPGAYGVGNGILYTSWHDLLWAAITIGRPSTYHVFRHGPASYHEAVFRAALVRLAVEQVQSGYLRRTNAYAALDPTEKGMVSYFLGMTFCKLFASQLLATPWLLHLDVFRSRFNVATLGRSRPDLFGQDSSGNWHAFESKGRSAKPSMGEKRKAKSQAQRLLSVDGQSCDLHIGSFTYFRSDILEFYWQDPEPNSKGPIKLPRPEEEWRYYYEPALSLATMPKESLLASDREKADIAVEIHPAIRNLLNGGRWFDAREEARGLRAVFESDGFQPDGIKVIAGESWSKPFEARERE